MASSNPSSSSRKRQAAEDLPPCPSERGPRATYVEARQFERAAHEQWHREWSEHHAMQGAVGLPMYPQHHPMGYHMWPMPMGHMMHEVPADPQWGPWMVPPPPPPPPSSTPPKALSSPSPSAPPPSPSKKQSDGSHCQDGEKKEKKGDEQPAADRVPQSRELSSAPGKGEKKDEAGPAMGGLPQCHRFPRYPQPEAVPRPKGIPYRGNSPYIRPPIIPIPPSMYGQHHLRPLNMNPGPVSRKRGPRNTAPTMVTPMYPIPMASPSGMMVAPMNPPMMPPPSDVMMVEKPKVCRRICQRKGAPEPAPSATNSSSAEPAPPTKPLSTDTTPAANPPSTDPSPVVASTVSEEANNNPTASVSTPIVKPKTDAELMPPPPVPRNITRFSKMELLEKIFLINPSPTIDQYCIVSEICEIPQKDLIRWYTQRRGRDDRVPVSTPPAPSKKVPKSSKSAKANVPELTAETITTAHLEENPDLSNVVLAEMSPTMAAVIIRIKRQVIVELSANIDGLRKEVRELNSNLLTSPSMDANFSALNELVAQLVKDSSLMPSIDPSKPSSSDPSQPSSSTDAAKNMPSPEEIVEFFNNYLMNHSEAKPEDVKPPQ